MGRFVIVFLPIFVVFGLVFFRRMFSTKQRAGYARRRQRLRAAWSWLVTTLVWSFVAYLVFLMVLFFVFQVDFGAFWRAMGSAGGL